MSRYQSYMICTAPRSGSTLLCSLLAATGVAGRPDSHFHRPSLADWQEAHGITPDAAAPERDILQAVVRAAIAEGSGDTGMFGLRMQRHSFDYFMASLAVLHPGLPDDVARIRAAFGHTLFIHLTRRDKVEQAVSLTRASQTGLWHVAPDGAELERLAPHREPAYDAEAIRAGVAEMTAADRDWEAWFAREGITPHRITYDALSADPAGTLGALLDRLVPGRDAARDVGPGTRKLADATSADWVARFRAENGLT
ncbi:sulfotransferase [Paroceanicella profunda]|uniref:Sulfotransferase n=1 Tax=Paroceanicella profunda TaxID=2579971 RepID=A0A5B8FZI6_9RHOB|nr:Stf0 family sulfotransferase [Paroceanicella profunda]QDL92189.1 sulfotransferase [Paroceanicella profunda]